jgi:outer membrane protein OmpA-like peptidoglycan-associated protein
MNNKQVKRVSFIQIITTSLTLLLLGACTGNNIVNLDSPVVQLQNLDDYDKDGVIEARDKCDETILGASIDNYGCGTQTSLIEPFKVNIKFENNSFVIPYLAYEKIHELARFLEHNQEIKVVVEGHTSKVGGKEFNQILSEKRAEAVVLMLKDNFKISEERLDYIGYGFQRLEDEGQTPEAHAANRRIMAELTHIAYLDEMEWTIYSVEQEL